MKPWFGKMIPGAVLCEVPGDVLGILRNHFNKMLLSKPNLHTSEYKQWFIQTEKQKKLSTDDTHFTEWQDELELLDVKNFFLKYVDNIYRLRYSTMPPTYKIDYHKPHIYPRIHIPVNEAKSKFTIDTQGKTFEFLLEQGYAYILNVTFPHTVICDTMRHNCFFSFTDFATEELKSKYWIY